MKKMAATIGVILAVFFLLLLSVVSFSILRQGVTSLNQAMEIKKWTTAKGVLHEVDLVEIGRRRRGTKVNVKYSYDVGGVTYDGDKVTLGTIGSSREQNYKIYSKLKSAKMIEVRFNPADHRQSTLTYGVTTSHFVYITLGATFLIVVLGMIILILLSLFSDAEISKSLVILE
jgi:Protein of unknown function (DUF3592)